MNFIIASSFFPGPQKTFKELEKKELELKALHL